MKLSDLTICPDYSPKYSLRLKIHFHINIKYHVKIIVFMF